MQISSISAIMFFMDQKQVRTLVIFINPKTWLQSTKECMSHVYQETRINQIMIIPGYGLRFDISNLVMHRDWNLQPICTNDNLLQIFIVTLTFLCLLSLVNCQLFICSKKTMKQAQSKPNSKEILERHQNYLFFINPLHAI